MGNIAHVLFINQCKEEETNMQGPHASMGDSGHGTFKPLRGRTSKDGWDMIGKRSSLIKYPKDGVIHCKAMQR